MMKWILSFFWAQYDRKIPFIKDIYNRLKGPSLSRTFFCPFYGRSMRLIGTNKHPTIAVYRVISPLLIYGKLFNRQYGNPRTRIFQWVGFYGDPFYNYWSTYKISFRLYKRYISYKFRLKLLLSQLFIINVDNLPTYNS